MRNKKYLLILTEKGNRFFQFILIVILAGLVVLAWKNAFYQDDAFISFRYAKNLVDGHGLVFNPGERVEGYTNFLWTLLMTIPIYFGYGPVVFSQMLGLVCFAGTLLLTYLTTVRIFKSQWGGVIVMLLLGLNYSFNAYATGGLETSLQAFLLASILYFFIRVLESESDIWNYVGISASSTFAFLNRLDASLYIAIIYFYLFVRVMFSVQIPKTKRRAIAILILPLVTVTAIWFAWKLNFYGDILPNTFYAKASSTQNPGIFWLGFLYLKDFFSSYYLIPFLFLGLRFLKRILKHTALAVLFLICLTWSLYIIYVGGDPFEFRFLVPIIPALMLLIYAVVTWLSDKKLHIVFFVMVFIGSLNHAIFFEKQNGIETIKDLYNYQIARDRNWVGIGNRLHELFGGSNEVVIATMPAGSIPFYSNLTTVDMHGLSDGWIAKNGNIFSLRKGHQRITTFQYLLDRKTNLLISYPYIVPISSKISKVATFREFQQYTTGYEWIKEDDIPNIPEEARLLEIPLDAEYKLLVVYLTPSEEIDKVITENGLKFVSIDIQ